MALVEVPVEIHAGALPSELSEVVATATRRIDAFVEARIRDPIPGFVPSDFEAVARVLLGVRKAWLAPGDLFLEWGSGFGVVALLASRLGFRAHGIEIQQDLVHASETLASELGADVSFHAGSFLPEGAEDRVPPMGEFAWLDTDAESAYEAMGLDPEDFDVIFAYPWPGEEEVVLELFDRYAARGALLVTYRGRDAVHVHRKVRERRLR
jgi:SAM-dependent methyltransferase